MLKFFVTLFLIAGGVTASDICDEGHSNCEHPPMVRAFPETNEELQKFCEPQIKFMECSFQYESTCNNMDPEYLQAQHRLLATTREICSEDTLLHAAVVDNLKCFAKVERKPTCAFDEPESDLIKKFATALMEEGVVSLDDNENATHKLYRCISTISFIACHSLVIGEKCGNVAMDAYVEIMQKARPGFIEGCAESFEYLPTIIRLRRVEEEKERSIAEAFRKRK